ncbi:unnamed protein product [Closterium sp. Naga37s-1]|nr:unnamed protein product [Closterium sp. Naga37s-1]
MSDALLRLSDPFPPAVPPSPSPPAADGRSRGAEADVFAGAKTGVGGEAEGEGLADGGGEAEGEGLADGGGEAEGEGLADGGGEVEAERGSVSAMLVRGLCASPPTPARSPLRAPRAPARRDDEGEERGGWAHEEQARGEQGRAREWEEAERQSREVKLGLHPLQVRFRIVTVSKYFRQVSAFAELHRVNRVLALSTSIRPPLHPRCKQTRYVVWYTRRQRQPPGQRSATSYEDSIRRIADFSTVEGFWGCYCRMVRPSALPAPTDVHVFKDGIRPLWEDGIRPLWEVSARPPHRSTLSPGLRLLASSLPSLCPDAPARPADPLLHLCPFFSYAATCSLPPLFALCASTPPFPLPPSSFRYPYVPSSQPPCPPVGRAQPAGGQVDGAPEKAAHCAHVGAAGELLQGGAAMNSRERGQMLMAVAGEQLEGAEEVCGVVLSVRFGEDILSIWNRSAPHSLARDRLCESIRKHLNLPPSYTMVRHAFRLHAIHHPLMLSTTPSFCLSPCALASSPALASSLPSPPPCPHLLPALTSSLPSPPPCPHLLPALTSSLPSPPPCPHLLPALTSSLPVTPPGVQAARRLTQGPFLLPQHLGAHIAHGHSAQRARQGDKSGCSIP